MRKNIDAAGLGIPSAVNKWLGGAILAYLGAILALLSTLPIRMSPDRRVIRGLIYVIGLAFLVVGTIVLWSSDAANIGADLSGAGRSSQIISATAVALAIYMIFTFSMIGTLKDLGVIVNVLVHIAGYFLLSNLFSWVATFESGSTLTPENIKHVKAGWGLIWLSMLAASIGTAFTSILAVDDKAGTFA